MLTVRPATPEDAERTFAWANDAGTRVASFSGEPIAWEDHLAWWLRLLDDPMAGVFIGEVDGEPVGVIRFEGDPDFAVVSVTVAPDHRGRGVGTELIRAGTAADGRNVNAYVICGNDASASAFTAAGYRPQGTVVLRGREAWRLDRPRTA